MPHCKRVGTINLFAGKNIGMHMLLKNTNWWVIAYVDESLNVNNVEFTIPNKMPGMN